MAQYSKTIPKNPANTDKTLEMILDLIIFQTEDGDELISYQNKPDKVVLTFDGEE